MRIPLRLLSPSRRRPPPPAPPPRRAQPGMVPARGPLGVSDRAWTNAIKVPSSSTQSLILATVQRILFSLGPLHSRVFRHWLDIRFSCSVGRPPLLYRPARALRRAKGIDRSHGSTYLHFMYSFCLLLRCTNTAGPSPTMLPRPLTPRALRSSLNSSTTTTLTRPDRRSRKGDRTPCTNFLPDLYEYCEFRFVRSLTEKWKEWNLDTVSLETTKVSLPISTHSGQLLIRYDDVLLFITASTSCIHNSPPYFQKFYHKCYYEKGDS